MSSYFSADFFSRNRERLRAAVGDAAPIIMAGNGLMQRAADSAYQFSQDASFWYLTGIEEPDVVLVMEATDTYLLLPQRSASREAFDGALHPSHLVERSGITSVLPEAEGWRRLRDRLTHNPYVYSVGLPPAYVSRYGIYTNPARRRMTTRLRRLSPGIDIRDLSPQLVRARSVKQPPEIEAIRSAINITTATLADVTTPKRFHDYRFEYEIEADIGADFRRRGASGHAFDPIIASGKRACTLHNVRNSGALKEGAFVVVDVGAEVEHYTADITRSVSYRGQNGRQTAVYEAVRYAQEQAIGFLRPGVILKEYERSVEQLVGEQLVSLGLIKDQSHASVRRYFPHACSHFLGLNVHDVGMYSEPLAAGMVLTVEPGIYIPEESIGVRIEDDILITENGSLVLSEALR